MQFEDYETILNNGMTSVRSECGIQEIEDAEKQFEELRTLCREGDVKAIKVIANNQHNFAVDAAQEILERHNIS